MDEEKCETRISTKLKGNAFETIVRPAMVHGLEAVALTRRQEVEVWVAEMKMLHLSNGSNEV